jgi:hypothetical protein
MAVGNADSAHVISFGEEEFQYHAPISHKTLGVRADVHALSDLGGTGGQQFGDTRNLDQAQATGADVIYAFEMAKGRDGNPAVSSGFEDRGAFVGADLFSVDS